MSILKKEWKGILGIGLGEALMAMNFSIVNIALATIQKELGASLSQLQWMINIYGIFICVSLVTMGRLADTYGRKRIYLIGLVGSSVASLIAGLASHPNQIIFAQLLQGLFGAILLPVSQSLITHLFPHNQKSTALGIWASIAGISLGAGPIIGGTILGFIGWRWIFLFNVPLSLIALFYLVRYVKESKSNVQDKHDYLGMLLFIGTIASVVLGIIQGPIWGWTSIWTLLCLISFLIFLPILIYVEKKAPYPIIQPDFFLRKDFLLPSMSNFCIIFYLWSFFFLIPLFAQSMMEITPFQTGLLMLFVTLPLAIGSPYVAIWYEKIGARVPMILGFLFLILSITSLHFLHRRGEILLMMAAMLFCGFGWVLIWGPSAACALSSLPKKFSAIASGAFTTFQEVGGTVGLAIVGTTFRSHPFPSTLGFQNSLSVLLGISLIGILTSFFVKKPKAVKS